MSEVKLLHGDCLDLMQSIPDKSVDMILCDLPYGTTACKWDVVIPFEPLWNEYNRIIKNNGAIVLFGSQPFTSKLVMSNLQDFKYEIIWQKTLSTNFMLSKKNKLQRNTKIYAFFTKNNALTIRKWKKESRIKIKAEKELWEYMEML